MSKPKMIGSINCYADCWAKIGHKKFNFDGTLKGLAQVALSKGAEEGDLLVTELGNYTLNRFPFDPRVMGYWPVRLFA